jgi:signal transduction histidine kinase
LTRQFAHTQAATETAKRAAAAREEVLQVVSHDLRNPLNAIVLGTQLLDDVVRDQAAVRHVAVVRKAADRMKHMIDELVDDARVESGTLRLEREPCDPGALVDAALDLFRDRATAASIALRADVACPDRALADRERAIQVLSNLLGNAIKVTPAGGTIVAGARADDDRIVFAVSDTGPGIAAADVPHLFERYWQGKRRRERGSLGLGLYICKRIVEAHGGRIGVDSAPEHGTTIWFTVPKAASRDRLAG